jgi:hypothetical protein
VERRRRTAARKSDLDRDKEDLMLAADEIERLRAALADDPDADICAENDNLRAEIELLRATIKDRDEWIARLSEHYGFALVAETCGTGKAIR